MSSYNVSNENMMFICKDAGAVVFAYDIIACNYLYMDDNNKYRCVHHELNFGLSTKEFMANMISTFDNNYKNK